MAKFQTGDHIIIINPEFPTSEFNGLCGTVILPSMGDNHFALVVLETPVECAGRPRYDWAVPKKHLILDRGVPRTELTEEQLSYL